MAVATRSSSSTAVDAPPSLPALADAHSLEPWRAEFAAPLRRAVSVALRHKQSPLLRTSSLCYRVQAARANGWTVHTQPRRGIPRITLALDSVRVSLTRTQRPLVLVMALFVHPRRNAANKDLLLRRFSLLRDSTTQSSPTETPCASPSDSEIVLSRPDAARGDFGRLRFSAQLSPMDLSSRKLSLHVAVVETLDPDDLATTVASLVTDASQSSVGGVPGWVSLLGRAGTMTDGIVHTAARCCALDVGSLRPVADKQMWQRMLLKKLGMLLGELRLSVNYDAEDNSLSLPLHRVMGRNAFGIPLTGPPCGVSFRLSPLGIGRDERFVWELCTASGQVKRQVVVGSRCAFCGANFGSSDGIAAHMTSWHHDLCCHVSRAGRPNLLDLDTWVVSVTVPAHFENGVSARSGATLVHRPGCSSAALSYDTFPPPAGGGLLSVSLRRPTLHDVLSAAQELNNIDIPHEKLCMLEGESPSARVLFSAVLTDRPHPHVPVPETAIDDVAVTPSVETRARDGQNGSTQRHSSPMTAAAADAARLAGGAVGLVRPYFHSCSNSPIIPGELDQESDEDIADAGVSRRMRVMISRFQDVSPAERVFMLLWSKFAADFRAGVSGHWTRSVLVFARSYGATILLKNLRQTFLMHLTVMWDRGLIESWSISAAMQIVDSFQLTLNRLRAVSPPATPVVRAKRAR
jgi:hypothetical protein